jgi:hypothetical protein
VGHLRAQGMLRVSNGVSRRPRPVVATTAIATAFPNGLIPRDSSNDVFPGALSRGLAGTIGRTE